MAEQPVGPGGHCLGQCEQSQGVAGGRGIKDDQVVIVRGRRYQPRDALQQCRLLGAGRMPGQLHLTRQLLQHLWRGQFAHLVDDAGQVSVHLGIGVNLHGIEVGQQATRAVIERSGKDIAQAVGRVGGHHQAAFAALGGKHGEGG